MKIDAENTTYTNMYKNMSGSDISRSLFYWVLEKFVLAVLTNLEKINSLPMEMQTMSFDKIIPLRKTNANGRTGF
jgi:hypothetical protein